MVQQLVPPVIEYPDSDGLPLADNTIQFRLITTIHGGLDALLPETFVAADLLWYPVEGDNKCRRAPDVMVAFGRPKGDRRSYKQWEECNIPPQVVFEIASDSNTVEELEREKLGFYQQHGVEEYYINDPERQTLKGWLRQESGLVKIAEMKGWVSPRLNVRFELEAGELQLYRPDGERFATYAEILEAQKQERARTQQAEAKAEQAEAKIQQAEAKVQQAEAKAARLAERLRELGIDPDDL